MNLKMEMARSYTQHAGFNPWCQTFQLNPFSLASNNSVASLAVALAHILGGLATNLMQGYMNNSTSSNVATRAAHDTRRYAEIAESTGIPVFGIKGKNIFGRLVDIPDNLPIDWMHCVCEGIMKRQLFK